MANPGGTAATQARNASGAIVHVEPALFQKLPGKSRNSLVVLATGVFFHEKLRILHYIRGLFYYTNSPKQLQFSGDTEVMHAKSTWVP